ncbi:MAG: WXG100 family type VII secretion target [Roseburia sp.]|nr:WXG100 family type VII secretion target [Roseburia sp.]MCM1096835.1 WXG100 family type VII secretion target [Ruminococcus flavefaciens]
MADNGQIIINYGKFDGHADGIDQKNKEMRQTLDDIQAKINGLKGDWESNGAETIRQKITNMTGRFENYQKVVDSYVKFIRDTKARALNLENTINANASQYK